MKPLAIYNLVSQISVLFPVIAGLSVYKKLTQPFRLFLYFFVLSIGFEIWSRFEDIVFHNNMPGMHVFTLVEFLAFSMIYYLHFKKNSIMRLLIAINGVIFVGIALADAFVINGIDGIKGINTLSRSYSFVFIVLYTLISFYHLLRKDDLQYSWVYPMFWVCVGALIYFAPNMLYFMLKAYLITNAPEFEKLGYHSHAAFNIIGNLLFAQSFRSFRKWKKES